jgi:MarR family transcriptional regulator for hemolysin
MRPTQPPIGLQLSRAARLVGRAFDDALVEAGGSLAVWLVLLNLKIADARSQRELADAVGIREATLTHHLNGMEADGLLTRRRSDTNRRVHVVALTDAGEAAFLRLRAAALHFDERLRSGLGERELAGVRRALDRLAANAVDADDGPTD